MYLGSQGGLGEGETIHWGGDGPFIGGWGRSSNEGGRGLFVKGGRNPFIHRGREESVGRDHSLRVGGDHQMREGGDCSSREGGICLSIKGGRDHWTREGGKSVHPLRGGPLREGGNHSLSEGSAWKSGFLPFWSVLLLAHCHKNSPMKLGHLKKKFFQSKTGKKTGLTLKFCVRKPQLSQGIFIAMF